MSAPYQLRDARPSDMAFVIGAWESSYMVRVKALIGREIRRAAHKARIRIACDREDDDTLLGFAALGPDELHYAYVKEAFRGEGIARDLLSGEPANTYTFRTDIGESRIKPEAHGLTYRPRIVL